MKTPVYSISGEKLHEIELPFQFSEPVRADLIQRAALAVQSRQHQPYGSDPRAGAKQGKAWPKRRGKFGGTYNKGISRVARKAMSHRGEQFNWVGALGAQTLKGVKAFPPEVGKVFAEKINRKENRKAIRSAIASTAVKEFVEVKHKIGSVKNLPLIVENKFEDLKRAKEVISTFEKLGLRSELERIHKKKVKSGKAARRGRSYRTKLGPVIVVSKSCELEKAAGNLIGVDVALVKSLNADMLSSGCQPARLAIWTQGAIEMLGKERLFA